MTMLPPLQALQSGSLDIGVIQKTIEMPLETSTSMTVALPLLQVVSRVSETLLETPTRVVETLVSPEVVEMVRETPTRVVKTPGSTIPETPPRVVETLVNSERMEVLQDACEAHTRAILTVEHAEDMEVHLVVQNQTCL